jgi:hypothetical protein
MARICYGEFDWPNYRAKQTYLRERFLAASARHANEVWRDLYELRPLYDHLKEAQGARRFNSPKDFSADDLLTASPDVKAFFNQVEENSSAELSWNTIGSVHRYECSRPSVSLVGVAPGHESASEIASLLEALKGWSVKWNLNADWCLESAYNTLRMWSAQDGPPERFWPDAESLSGWIPMLTDPPPGFPLYLPTEISHDDYLSTVRSLRLQHGSLKQAEAYCLEVEQCYEQARYIHCKAGEKRKLDQHLEWTVKFQVFRKSLDDIATTAGDEAAGGVEKSTVMSGVYDILRLIGLEKHSDAKRGRRLGSKGNTKPIREVRRGLAR